MFAVFSSCYAEMLFLLAAAADVESRIATARERSHLTVFSFIIVGLILWEEICVICLMHREKCDG